MIEDIEFRISHLIDLISTEVPHIIIHPNITGGYIAISTFDQTKTPRGIGWLEPCDGLTRYIMMEKNDIEFSLADPAHDSKLVWTVRKQRWRLFRQTHT